MVSTDSWMLVAFSRWPFRVGGLWPQSDGVNCLLLEHRTHHTQGDGRCGGRNLTQGYRLHEANSSLSLSPTLTLT